MKKRILYLMALLLTATTGAWADDNPEPIDLISSDGKVWTLASSPDYDVELEVEYYTDAELAQAVDDLIAAIGTVEYTDACKAKIDAAREAYDALTDAQKALVTNYDTLTTAETNYADLKAAADQAAADDVIGLINAIGEVAYTNACKAKIDAARTAYDALTDAQKALVTNYETLTTAETTYIALKVDAGNVTVEEVIGLINAIGEVVYTDECKAKIDIAHEAYNTLTAEQQALVSNYETLTTAETAYANLKAIADQFTAGVELTTTDYKTWTLADTPFFDIELEVEYENLTLSEATDNAATLTEWNGYEADVTLTRTLQTGGWNTFTVPFNLTIPEGWTVKKLTGTTYEAGTLTLTFDDATSIEAGKPYLIKVGNDNVVNPTFSSVTIANSTTTTETTYADFVPVMNPTNLNGDDKSVLFVSGGNTLTYPNKTGNINAFRAYFQLKGDAIEPGGGQARTFAMNFGDEQTGIKAIEHSTLNIDHSIYDLQGRKFNGQSSMVNGQLKKGVYLVNGKKVVIK